MKQLALAFLFAFGSLAISVQAEQVPAASIEASDAATWDMDAQRGPPRAPRRPPRRGPPRRPPGVPPPAAGPQYVGNFDVGNPFSWDTETVSPGYIASWYGVAFELDRGTDVELSTVRVICSRGNVCYSANLRNVVSWGRPVYLGFPNWLDVRSIQVKAKPQGISVPPPQVNVYLYQ